MDMLLRSSPQTAEEATRAWSGAAAGRTSQELTGIVTALIQPVQQFLKMHIDGQRFRLIDQLEA